MQLGFSEKWGVLASTEVRDTFMEQIKAKQIEDEDLEEFIRLCLVRHKRPLLMQMLYSILKGGYVFL